MRYLCSSSLPLYKGVRLVRVFLHRPAVIPFHFSLSAAFSLHLSSSSAFRTSLFFIVGPPPAHIMRILVILLVGLNCLPTPSIRTFIHPPSFVVVALLFIPVVQGEADIDFSPSSSSLVLLHCRLHQSSPLTSSHAFNASQLLSNRSSHWMQACLSIFCCSTS